jgi:phosphatidylethanolamine-binding protein (PEBP) family uncharacterized protein
MTSSTIPSQGLMPPRHDECRWHVAATGVDPGAGAESFAILMDQDANHDAFLCTGWHGTSGQRHATPQNAGMRLTEPEACCRCHHARSHPADGPRPPVMDPAAHRYRFQVFALDTVLQGAARRKPGQVAAIA